MPLNRTGPTGRSAGYGYGIQFRKSPGPLLPKTRHDEERIVDSDRKPNHRDQVLGERLHLYDLADEEDGTKGDDDRGDRQHHGKNRGRQRTEQHGQDDQRDRHAEGLALLRVGLVAFDEVSGECRLAGYEYLELVACFCLVHHIEYRFHV